MEGELAGEVIHAAGVHETQGAAHGFGAQHALARGGADAPVGQRGGHEASGVAGHLDGTELQEEMRRVQVALLCKVLYRFYRKKAEL